MLLSLEGVGLAFADKIPFNKHVARSSGHKLNILHLLPDGNGSERKDDEVLLLCASRLLACLGGGAKEGAAVASPYMSWYFHGLAGGHRVFFLCRGGEGEEEDDSVLVDSRWHLCSAALRKKV
jgi:hypothetical protein